MEDKSSKDTSNKKNGKVILVGAGPGDPGLITLNGVRALEEADVILYDYLANPSILQYANPAAEKVCLGKHGNSRIWTQAEINQDLVERAKTGKTIVRLKGGDPGVFARGAEEAEVLAAAGIPFEIIPGITAALAAGSYAGVPITHRDHASAVALITGQQRAETEEQTDLDYETLAKFPGTLVFYMGITTIAKWSAGLLKAGKPAATPTALIRRCSFADQQSWFTTLGEVGELVQGKIRPPVVVIVGDVARLADTLSWFDKRPLFGQRILVTRAASDRDKLTDRLTRLGGNVFSQPTIQIAPPSNWQDVDDVIRQLADQDAAAIEWLMFSSSNGVHYFMQRVMQQHDVRILGRTKIATVGASTAESLQQYNLKADFVPEQRRAESLAKGLIDACTSPQKIVSIRASRGRDVLAKMLTEAGHDIREIVAYEHTDVEQPDEDIATSLKNLEFDWVTVTSSAIARSLVQMFGDDLQETKLVSISPITTDTLKELGFAPAAEATSYDMDGVVAAIMEAVSS
jgi:uroporphyrinogen III methyltransferase/synthase